MTLGSALTALPPEDYAGRERLHGQIDAERLDALLQVARRHKVQAFKLNGLEVSFSPLALTESVPSRRPSKADEDAAAELARLESDALLYHSAE